MLELGSAGRVVDLDSRRIFPDESLRGLIGLSIRTVSSRATCPARMMLDKNISFKGALLRLATRPENSHDIGGILPELVLHETSQLTVKRSHYSYTVNRDFRGKALVAIEEVTKADISRCSRLMEEWLHSNLSEEGCLTYMYHPSEDRRSPNKNRIRDFMGTLALQTCARRTGLIDHFRKADLNLMYNLQEYYQEEFDYAVIRESDKVKLGAVALAALAVRGRFAATIPAQAEERLSKLTHTLQRIDGSFRTFLRPAERNEDCQNFYPGETLLLWTSQLQSGRDAGLLKRIMLSFSYYRSFHREDRNPAFVPWHTQACYQLFQITGYDEVKDFIFEMNDWLLAFQQPESQLPAFDMDGRFYSPDKPYGPPHASSTGVYMEGLCDALALAIALGQEERAEKYTMAIKRGLRNIMQLQFSQIAEIPSAAKSFRTLGGVRTTEYNNVIRVDNVQHNYLAMQKILSLDTFPW
ncbi:hypothetical protein [Paraburkholderia caledonica]|uniref:Uncharacterized protein n=1 Tax=Paraburkholderia caledonica TaxID=134536 RepID=A0AB73INA3_9BURK|nr:hypothetical protein [Paraburkholderia caledonica]